MRYEEAKKLIKDGDLIAVRTGAYGPWFRHTAVALWLDRGLWCAEMGLEGNRLVPLSTYRGADFDVYDCPVDRTNVRRWVLEVMREPLDCDALELLAAAFNRALDLPLLGMSACEASGYNAANYLWAGWSPARLPVKLTPTDLVAALGGAPKLTVEGR